MKLVIEDLSDVEFIEYRRKPVEGYRAVRMAFDFSVVLPDSEVNLQGKAGQWLVEGPDKLVDIYSDAEFAEQFGRVGAPRSRQTPGAAPKGRGKTKATVDESARAAGDETNLDVEPVPNEVAS